MLDVGTANALELRRTGSKASRSRAGGCPEHDPAAANAASDTAAPHTTTGAACAAKSALRSGRGRIVLFDPPALTQAKGATFTVNVMVSGGQNVYSVPLQLNYDANSCRSSTFRMEASSRRTDKRLPSSIATILPPEHCKLRRPVLRRGGRVRPGAVVTLTFMAKAPGQSQLTITRGGARDPAMQAIAMSGAQAAVTVQ